MLLRMTPNAQHLGHAAEKLHDAIVNLRKADEDAAQTVRQAVDAKLNQDAIARAERHHDDVHDLYEEIQDLYTTLVGVATRAGATVSIASAPKKSASTTPV
jgi:uncharacterized protein (UPF0335 family)